MVPALTQAPLRFPFPPYPRGWFAVGVSASLSAGSLRAIHYFGRELVLMRTEKGEARVMEAYCVHRGTHIGHSGAVTGEHLRCSQHRWCYDGVGRCVVAPGMAEIPESTHLRVWPVRECNGMILVYHAADPEPGNPLRLPPAGDEVPDVSEFASADWTAPRLLHFIFRSRNQEVMENSFDAAHFVYIHGTPRVPVFDNIEANESSLRVYTDALDVRVYGLGLLVVRDLSCLAGRGRGNMHFTFVTPIDEETIEVWMNLCVRRLDSEAETVAMEEMWQDIVRENFERDIVIWEHKAYIAAPVLAENDGPIPVFRRWAQQFYGP